MIFLLLQNIKMKTNNYSNLKFLNSSIHILILIHPYHTSPYIKKLLFFVQIFFIFSYLFYSLIFIFYFRLTLPFLFIFLIIFYIYHIHVILEN